MAQKFITARQLAAELLKHPNDIVCSTSSNYELRGAKIPTTSAEVTRYKGEIKEEIFKDDFDGGSYSKKVVKRNEKGKKYFVEL